MIELLTSHLTLELFFIGLISAIIGSFINVVIVRLPIMLEYQWHYNIAEFSQNIPSVSSQPQRPTVNLCRPRSRCPHCTKTLLLRDNIPVLSYFWLKGYCRFCQKPISKQYPIVELITVIISLCVFYRFNLSPPMAFACCFSWFLIALAAIDLNTYLLPDRLTLPLLWLGLLLSVFQVFIPSSQAILGAALGYVILWLPATLFLYYRNKIGMGQGDFKLLAAIGAWVGVTGLINVIFIAVFIALGANIFLLAFKKIHYNQPTPFGPALAIAGTVILLWGPFITTGLMQ